MPPLSKLRQIEDQNVELQNSLARIEAKLDFLMKASLDPKEMEGLRLPRAKKLPSEEVVEPYNVRMQNRISTSPVPKAVATEFTQQASVVPKGKDSIKPPKTPTDSQIASVAVAEMEKQPVKGYDAMTIGEVLKKVKEIKTKEERDAMLDYERRHLNREQVVQALVNWNS